MFNAFRLFLAAVACAGSASFALAQRGGEPGTVSASGSKLVKEKPTEMRMTIRLAEKASTLKEALGKLKTRTDAAKLQLEQLGTIKGGVEIADPTASSEMTEQERRMRQMMAMRSARGGGGRKPKEPPKSVTVASTVTAKWALGKKSGVELLEFCQDVQDKVAAADLAGLKEKKTLSAEEEELAEEAEQMMGSFDERNNPAEPAFFFAGKISAEARGKAMKEAFEKAKEAAESLAKAAGAKLGKLSSLGDSTSSYGGSDFEPDYSYGSRYDSVRRMMGRNDSENQDEVLSPSPDSVGLHVAVHATFTLE
jgi:hypothetical protein